MADALLHGSSSRSSGPGAASPREAPTHTARAVLHALVLFTCVGGIVENGLVVRLLGSRWQRGTVGIYILHLAAADLLFLLCSAPLIVPNANCWAARVHHLGCLAGRSTKHLAHTAGPSLLTAPGAQPGLCGLVPTWCWVHWRPRLWGLVGTTLWLLALLLTALALYFHEEARHPHLQPGPAVDTVFHSFVPASFTTVVALPSMALCLQAQRSSRPRQRWPTRLYVAILVAPLCSASAPCPSASPGSSSAGWTCPRRRRFCSATSPASPCP